MWVGPEARTRRARSFASKVAPQTCSSAPRAVKQIYDLPTSDKSRKEKISSGEVVFWKIKSERFMELHMGRKNTNQRQRQGDHRKFSGSDLLRDDHKRSVCGAHCRFNLLIATLL